MIELFKNLNSAYNNKQPNESNAQMKLKQIFESSHPTKNDKVICLVFSLSKSANVDCISKISKDIEISNENTQTVLGAVILANKVVEQIHFTPEKLVVSDILKSY